MAQQGTEEQTSSDQPSSGEDAATGRHRAADEGASEQQSASSEAETEQSGPADAKTERSDSSEATTEQQSAPSEAKTEQQSAPSEAKTEQQSAPSEAKTERTTASRGQQGGGADTSWAEPETTRRRHVDVGEIAWRAGNVIATVLRTLAFLFALVLVANLVLVLVGVNPANGVAQFIGGLADRVILGFRDLFVPADPTIALIVNSLIAAVFWVFVGELASRLVRFLAARVK